MAQFLERICCWGFLGCLIDYNFDGVEVTGNYFNITSGPVTTINNCDFNKSEYWGLANVKCTTTPLGNHQIVLSLNGWDIGIFIVVVGVLMLTYLYLRKQHPEWNLPF